MTAYPLRFGILKSKYLNAIFIREEVNWIVLIRIYWKETNATKYININRMIKHYQIIAI